MRSHLSIISLIFWVWFREPLPISISWSMLPSFLFCSNYRVSSFGQFGVEFCTCWEIKTYFHFYTCNIQLPQTIYWRYYLLIDVHFGIFDKKKKKKSDGYTYMALYLVLYPIDLHVYFCAWYVAHFISYIRATKALTDEHSLFHLTIILMWLVLSCGLMDGFLLSLRIPPHMFI